MIDVVEILIHWYVVRSQHELSASLGGGPQDGPQVRGHGGDRSLGLRRVVRRWPRPTGAGWCVSGYRSRPTPGCGRCPGRCSQPPQSW